MGKGKGSFDHWAARVAVNQIALELRGVVHEQVVRDAFRLAGNKLPGEPPPPPIPPSIRWGYARMPTKLRLGQWQFVKRGAPPVVGITKLDGSVTMEELKRPRRKIAAETVQAAPPPSSESEGPHAPLDMP